MKEKSSYHHPDLKQTLLDTAVIILNEEGHKGLTLRKLAAKAGVSHSAPYRHFSSKEEIIATLMLEGHRRLRLTLNTAREKTPGTSSAKLLALGRAYLEFAKINREYLAIMFSKEGLAASMELGSKLEHVTMSDYDSFGVLEAAVLDCQIEGSLDSKADTGAMSLHIWSGVHGLAVLRNEGLLAGMASQRGKSETETLGAIFEIMRKQFGA